MITHKNIKKFRVLSVGDHRRVSSCYLVGVAHRLPARDLRHSLQTCMQNATSDMT